MEEKEFTQFDWTHDHFGSTFLGVPMLQKWVDLVLWEHMLNDNKISTILEIGTGSGAFSMFLLTQVLKRGLRYKTVDSRAVRSVDESLKKYLAPFYVELDVLTRDGRDTMVQYIRSLPKPVLLFCDGGNKRMEVDLLLPHLVSGDYIGVHDWWTEIHDEHMEVHMPLLDPLYEEQCAKMTSITRFWRVK